MKCPKCNIQVKGTGKQWVESYRNMMYTIHVKDCDWICKLICDECLLFHRHVRCKSNLCGCRKK